MTSTIQSRVRNARSRSGFTLAEVMVASALSVALLTAVLSSVIFMTKSGYQTVSYTDIEAQTRKGLELFARDVRMASDIIWNSQSEIVLTIPMQAGNETVRYSYNDATKVFTRQRLTPAAGTPELLFSGIETLTLSGFKITGAPVNFDDLAVAANETKQIQLTVTSARTRTTLAAVHGNVLSARFILRNKRVTT